MKYRTIVADPPWPYSEGWPAASTSPNSAFNRRGVVPLDTTRRDPLPYSSMSIEEVAELPVADLADTDAHLFLWTTNRYLWDCPAIITSWGFRVSQVLTWCKPPRGIGPGGLFSNTSEFVVYARRGSPPHQQRQDSTWWRWGRCGHSVKPDAFLDIIEAAVSGPYLELFARRQRLGWDTWGNEALVHVEITEAWSSW